MGKHKKQSKEKKKRKHSSSSSEDEWVEKPPPQQTTFKKPEKDDWFDVSNAFTNTTTKERQKSAKATKKQDDTYDPRKSSRELNPYWQNGGDGLPTQQTPSKPLEAQKKLDPNAIAAKIIKAELMGNTKLIEDLKLQLEEAKRSKDTVRDVILSENNRAGSSRPLKLVEDLEKHSLKEMFEAEKYSSSYQTDREFAKVASTLRDNDEDFDFTSTASTSSSKQLQNAINDHQKLEKRLDNCSKCFGVKAMQKHLVVSYNDLCYLSITAHEPLVHGHCTISPVRHASCSLDLDENEWREVRAMQSKCCRLFEPASVVFFETASNLNRRPHMTIECVPIPTKKSELVRIYFKKALEDTETDWAMNKKVVNLSAGRDVRRAIPKGLPYFFVTFDGRDGFAHVIEDQRTFSHNFAREIVAGVLKIDDGRWRRPKMQQFDEQKERADDFRKLWKNV